MLNVSAAVSFATHSRGKTRTFPAPVGVAVLVVAFVLTLLSFTRDLSGALWDQVGVLDLIQLIGGLLLSPCPG
jgi:hypothetical protein